MVKRSFAGLLIMLAITGFSISGLQAQDSVNDADSNISGKIGIGARYGYVDQKDEEGRHEGTGNITFGLNDFTAIEFEGGVIANKDMDERELYSGFADLLLRMPIENIAPYVRGGVGVQARRYRDLDNWDDSFSQRAGAGVEIFLTRNVAVNGEAIYVWGGNESFDAAYYRGGIKLYF